MLAFWLCVVLPWEVGVSTDFCTGCDCLVLATRAAWVVLVVGETGAFDWLLAGTEAVVETAWVFEVFEFVFLEVIFDCWVSLLTWASTFCLGWVIVCDCACCGTLVWAVLAESFFETTTTFFAFSVSTTWALDFCSWSPSPLVSAWTSLVCVPIQRVVPKSTETVPIVNFLIPKWDCRSAVATIFWLRLFFDSIIITPYLILLLCLRLLCFLLCYVFMFSHVDDPLSKSPSYSNNNILYFIC